ncbi:hypothetical protein B0H11DRAFT_1902814 [Mycena galericulata]|nr:hypothetical protein B0H11DRAFT_1902814 [Mycena galericulata]
MPAGATVHPNEVSSGQQADGIRDAIKRIVRVGAGTSKFSRYRISYGKRKLACGMDDAPKLQPNRLCHLDSRIWAPQLLSAPPQSEVKDFPEARTCFKTRIAECGATRSASIGLGTDSVTNIISGRVGPAHGKVINYLFLVEYGPRSASERIDVFYDRIINPMRWQHIRFTRYRVYNATPAYPRGHFGWLIPDGDEVKHRIWIKTPVKRGLRRALTVEDLDTDIWLDCGRGAGSAVSDSHAFSLDIRRFPFDEPKDMRYTYSIVVTSQRTTGGVVHPENDYINSLVPERDVPWRGNVLVFRHGRTAAKPIINMSQGDQQLMEAILTKVFREDLVNLEDLTIQIESVA